MRVQLSGIHVRRNGLNILRDLNLETYENEYVVLLGNNGSGKTTTLRTIAGLQPTESGVIQFDETSIDHLPPRRRSISMVFQDDTLYPHLKIGTALRDTLPPQLSSSEKSQQLREISERLKIAQLLDRYPDQLSGGEKRRTAIALAMAKNADVRLLDEPLSSLDATMRPFLLHEIQQWHQAAGGTTIHVTHDSEEAMQVADRIAILSDGRIVQFDTPTKIHQQPAHLDAALLIGNPMMNLLDDDGQTSNHDHHRIELPNDLAQVLKSRQQDSKAPCIIGIRPQHLSFELCQQPPCRQSSEVLILTATLGQFWNSGTDFHATLIWKENILRFTIKPEETQQVERLHSTQPGELITLRAASNDVHLFDAKSGERLND